MTAEMKNITFDQIQLEAESFAVNYRKTHDVPPFPSDVQLQKYKKILNTKYSPSAFERIMDEQWDLITTRGYGNQ